jgi:hypothetical protein
VGCCVQILEKHPNGVWASKVPDEYTNLYGEQLPADWLQQTMDCPRVDPNVISDKQIILVLAEPSTSSEADNDKVIIVFSVATESLFIVIVAMQKHKTALLGNLIKTQNAIGMKL